MNPLEQQIKDALHRHAPDALPRDEAWSDVRARIRHAEQRRGLATTAMAVVAVVMMTLGIAIAVPRIGGSDDPTFAGGGDGPATFKLSSVVTSRGPDGRTVEMRMEGEFDTAKTLGRLEMTFPPMPEGHPPVTTETIITETHLYMRVPPGDRSEVPPGKTWVRTPISEEFRRFFQTSYEGDPFTPGADPAAYFEHIRALAESVREVGREGVRGTAATRYEVVIDVDQVIAKLPPSYRGAYETQLRGVGDTLAMHLWIGDDGLPYRMRYEIDSPELGTGTVLVEMYDYGVALDIRLPSAEDTYAAPYGMFSGPVTGVEERELEATP